MHDHLHVNHGTLYIEGCSTLDLARTYKTPLYVLSETSIRDKCRHIKETFIDRYQDVHVAYASKALLTTALVKIINQEGLFMDVVSGGELYTAIHADFPTEKIIFHGNNKSVDELAYAIQHQVGRIVVDNVYELKALNTLCAAFNRRTKVLFRITPGVSSITHDYISTGQKDSKFGISMQEEILFPAIQEALDQPLIEFLGFHFHVGSQIFDHGSHIKATEIAMNLVHRVQSHFGIEIKELNTGGGYAVKYTEQDKPMPIAYFTDAIMKTIIDYSEKFQIKRPTVFIEPGRYIIAEAGITLYSLGAEKTIPGIKTYVSVDGGMTDNIRPALYQAKYDAKIANKMDHSATQVVTICGKCCESGDILIEDLPLPIVEEEDLLVVFTTGAYNYAMASHYNKHTIPAMVLVNGEKAHEIIRRETYADLVRYDQVPDHLK